jgi:hypothetical protein
VLDPSGRLLSGCDAEAGRDRHLGRPGRAGQADRQRAGAERRTEGGEEALSGPWGAHHFDDSARTARIPTQKVLDRLSLSG